MDSATSARTGEEEDERPSERLLVHAENNSPSTRLDLDRRLLRESPAVEGRMMRFRNEGDEDRGDRRKDGHDAEVPAVEAWMRGQSGWDAATVAESAQDGGKRGEAQLTGSQHRSR